MTDDHPVDAIEWAADQGVTLGCDDAKFCADQSLKRKHAWVLIERVYDQVLADGADQFTDPRLHPCRHGGSTPQHGRTLATHDPTTAPPRSEAAPTERRTLEAHPPRHQPPRNASVREVCGIYKAVGLICRAQPAGESAATSGL